MNTLSFHILLSGNVCNIFYLFRLRIYAQELFDKIIIINNYYLIKSICII